MTPPPPPPRIVLPGGDQVFSARVWRDASHIQNNTRKPTPCEADSGHPKNSGTKFLPSQLRIITHCGGLMPDVAIPVNRVSFLLCVDVCECVVCVHSVCVSVHMWGAPVCGCQRSVPGVFHNGSSPYPLRQISCWTWSSPIQLCWLAQQDLPVSCPTSGLGITNVWSCAWPSRLWGRCFTGWTLDFCASHKMHRPKTTGHWFWNPKSCEKTTGPWSKWLNLSQVHTEADFNHSGAKIQDLHTVMKL